MVGHPGILADDPRNHGPIELLRPVELTPSELQERIETIAARVRNPITKASILERAARVPTTVFRPAPPLSVAAGAFTWNDLAYAAHPDLVIAIQNDNKTLPEDCLCLFWGRPALVHPSTGVVFGVAIGSIGIAGRIPPATGDVTRHIGSRFDLSLAGPEWCFIEPNNDRWCAIAYEEAGRPPTMAIRR